MDYEALKEQWSEVEDRDGVRLSWNVFPSSRMVSYSHPLTSLVDQDFLVKDNGSDVSHRKHLASSFPLAPSTPL